MAVPSEEDFVAYLELLAVIRAPRVAEAICTELPTELGRIRDLVIQGEGILTDRLANSFSHVVGEWLDGQETVKVAQNRAFGKFRSKSGHEEHVERIARSVSSHISEFMKAEGKGTPDLEKLHKQISRYFEMPAYARWRFGVVASLVEYHYKESASGIASCHKNLPAFVDEATKQLENIKKRVQSEFSRHNDIIDWSAFARNIERSQQTLEKYFSPGVHELYPIKRNDKTAKERIFVFWMERCHNGLFRASRPEAISLLLDIEGFRFPLDVRQVEKICAGFREARMKRRRFLQHYD